MTNRCAVSRYAHSLRRLRLFILRHDSTAGFTFVTRRRHLMRRGWSMHRRWSVVSRRRRNAASNLCSTEPRSSLYTPVKLSCEICDANEDLLCVAQRVSRDADQVKMSRSLMDTKIAREHPESLKPVFGTVSFSMIDDQNTVALLTLTTKTSRYYLPRIGPHIKICCFICSELRCDMSGQKKCMHC